MYYSVLLSRHGVAVVGPPLTDLADRHGRAARMPVSAPPSVVKSTISLENLWKKLKSSSRRAIGTLFASMA
jgi:hypothetical protein